MRARLVTVEIELETDAPRSELMAVGKYVVNFLHDVDWEARLTQAVHVDVRKPRTPKASKKAKR